MPRKDLQYPEDWQPIEWPVMAQAGGQEALIDGLKLLEARIELLRKTAVRQYEVERSRVY